VEDGLGGAVLGVGCGMPQRMVRIPWTPQPIANRVGRLRQFTRKPVELAAEGFAFKLDDNYSHERGGPRTGPPDPSTGRPRSILGEFPQEQTGLLRSAIFYEPLDPSATGFAYWKVGLNTDLSRNPADLQEYLAYIEGYRPTGGSRFGLAMTGESQETHAYMLQHLQAYLNPARSA